MQQYLGIVGNGETCALVSPRGSINWLCLPRFDGDLVFARALDPVNGEEVSVHLMEDGLELAPLSAQQAYEPRTNILTATLAYHDLTMLITDLMPWGERAIVRKVAIHNRSDKSRVIDIALRTRKPAGKDLRYRELADGDVIAKGKGYALGIVFPIRRLSIEPRQSMTLSIVLCYDTNARKLAWLLESWRHRDVEEVLRVAHDFWRCWLERGGPLPTKGPDAAVLERSLLAMKLLQHARTGAFVAAATASLPAYPGMNDNWDYRFCWIRDLCFACRAFLLTGHFEEAKLALTWLFSIQGRDGHWRQPFYTVDGEEPPKEFVTRLRGPRRELNIRVNNGARDQLQLDSEGSVLHLLYLYLVFSRDEHFVRQHWDDATRAADWIAEHFAQPEHGIWEFRERRMQWTYGKALCSAGLEAAMRIAEGLELTAKPEWPRAKRRLARQLLVGAWSEQRRSFVQTYEKDAPLDISVLALEEAGLVAPTDRRMRMTVQRIEERLVLFGGVRRFEGAVLPFYLATLWLAGHYIRSDERKRARALIDHAIANLTDLALCAEHYDPRTGHQHGNFPQLFNHSMLAEQLVLYSHERSLTSELSFLMIPFKASYAIVDRLLVNPLRRFIQFTIDTASNGAAGGRKRGR